MMGCHGQETSLMASGRWLPYVDKIPCDGPIGVCARRLTAERSPRTKMLRALKTLQPENDTRRLRLVSMNRGVQAVRQFFISSLGPQVSKKMNPHVRWDSRQ